MRLLSFLLAFVLVTFLGCSDLTSPTGPHDSSSVTAESSPAKWDNNPDNGNLRIYRGPVHWASSWTDPLTGLRATHTTVPLGGETDCGLLDLIDPIAHQDVGLFDPDDPESRLHHVVDGEVWIIVRDTNQPGDCFGGTLMAEGLGDFHVNDNDVTASLATNSVNTWGFSGHGDVVTPGGDVMRYNGHIKYAFGYGTCPASERLYCEEYPDGTFFKIKSVKVNFH